MSTDRRAETTIVPDSQAQRATVPTVGVFSTNTSAKSETVQARHTVASTDSSQRSSEAVGPIGSWEESAWKFWALALLGLLIGLLSHAFHHGANFDPMTESSCANAANMTTVQVVVSVFMVHAMLAARLARVERQFNRALLAHLDTEKPAKAVENGGKA